MMARTFEQTSVWMDTRALVSVIYALTRKRTFRNDRGLVEQIRRAAVSILSNISEGFERGGNAELMHFLFIAKGSAGEVRAQLYVAGDQGYLDREELEDCLKRCRSISAQLAGLIGYLKRSPL